MTIPETLRSMPRLMLCSALLLLATAVAGCDDDAVTGPSTPTSTPVTITESFSETVTVNGARSHVVVVTTVGEISAQLTALAPDAGVTVGLALGTWNIATNTCQIILANDAARLSNAVVGTASTIGNFCVRVYDVGRLSAASEYTVTVTHF